MKRNIGLDVLRILAMLMIVFQHVIGKGMFRFEINNEEFYKFILFIRTFCIVAVNCFVLITGYFQVKSNFKLNKVIDIWLKVMFYSVSIYIVLLLFNQADFNIKDAIKSFFPIITNEYWFVNCYLLLYILSPYINKMIYQLTRKDLKKLIIFLLIIFCLFPSILPSAFVLDTTRGYRIIWFVILYLIGAYIRLYMKLSYQNKRNLTLFFITNCFSFCLVLAIQYICNIIHISDISERLYNYNFLFVFLSSLFLFLYFKNVNIKNNKLIKLVCKLSPLVFGVYIIHEQVVLRGILYLNILNLDWLWNNPLQLVIIPLITIIIFLVCILIEKITQGTIQDVIRVKFKKIYINTRKNKFYKKVHDGLSKYILT